METGSNAWATLIGIALGVIVYGAVLLLIGGMSRGDVEQIPFLGIRIVPILRKLGLFNEV